MAKQVNILADGTLLVLTRHYEKVKRVLVEHGLAGTLYYPDNPDWIPIEEGLPEDIKPVIVTYKNHNPASYYQEIKDKYFSGVAYYFDGKWFWYSDITKDILAEYGKCDIYEILPDIEIVAWQPLPKPYMKGE